MVKTSSIKKVIHFSFVIFVSLLLCPDHSHAGEKEDIEAYFQVVADLTEEYSLDSELRWQEIPRIQNLGERREVIQREIEEIRSVINVFITAPVPQRCQEYRDMGIKAYEGMLAAAELFLEINQEMAQKQYLEIMNITGAKLEEADVWFNNADVEFEKIVREFGILING